MDHKSDRGRVCGRRWSRSRRMVWIDRMQKADSLSDYDHTWRRGWGDSMTS